MLAFNNITKKDKQCPVCSTEYTLDKIDHCIRCGLKRKPLEQKYQPAIKQNTQKIFQNYCI